MLDLGIWAQKRGRVKISWILCKGLPNPETFALRQRQQLIYDATTSKASSEQIQSTAHRHSFRRSIMKPCLDTDPDEDEIKGKAAKVFTEAVKGTCSTGSRAQTASSSRVLHNLESVLRT